FLPLMGTLGGPIWKTEMERIKKLQWWDKVKAVKGFPADPDVWHMHPIGLVGNFAYAQSCNCINYDAIWVPHAAPAYRESQIVNWSHYRLPIDTSPGRVSGNSRRGGDASKDAQMKVIDFLVQKGRQYHLNREDIAMVLAMTRHESGFNPDAAAGTTSASGLGQFVDQTASSYGINTGSQRFDAEQGADAMVRHYLENKRLAIAGGATGRNIFVMTYAYHHDGPSLAYGGKEISESKVMPVFDLILNNICSNVAD
uniref:lytic transglycosylase domain-containing protein n=1 Tax=Paraburkholderia acidipaludis TaxID=660537 RepID=UPI0012EC4779